MWTAERFLFSGMLGIGLAAGCASEPADQPLSFQLEQEMSVGVMGGDQTQEFGLILDVRVLEDGSFFVLDVQQPSVEWFDRDGVHRGGVHSRGEGPGELASASAIAVAPGEILSVLDPANGRISRFRFGQDSLVYGSAIRGAWSPFSSGRILCSVAARMFLRDVHGDQVVHEVDPDSGIVRSFDPVVQAAPEEFGEFANLVTRERSSGHLLCSSDPPMVISMSSHHPHVRAFSPEGELLWEHSVREFRPWRWVPTASTPEYEVDPEGGSHMGQSIMRWDQDHVLVQYSVSPEPGVPDDRDFFRLESRLLSIADGREVGWTDELPLLAGAVGDRLVSFENVPYPQVRILRQVQ